MGAVKRTCAPALSAFYSGTASTIDSRTTSTSAMPLREVAMPSISVITNQGQRVALEGQEVAELKSALGDRLLTPSSTGYDEARSIWNAMIDRRPAVIARCESAAEVAQAVRVAATNNLLVSIKGGGHNIAGNAVCRDGLMIDLSLMKRVVVD